ncbi:MAG: DEAD/DEAH box helicase [Patescibacteria group bacterium]|jgi:transcription-repair coupling factor (superfamily II helicase)
MSTLNRIIIQSHNKYPFRELISSLLDFGYEREQDEIKSGYFGISGGVIKIFPVNDKDIYLVEFFGDEVDAMYILRDGKQEKFFGSLVIEKNIVKLSDGSILSPESYAVHEDYGIGQFRNIETLLLPDGEQVKYINFIYLNEEVLRVPENQIDKLSRYIGVGQRKPKLNRLGSVAWKNTYKRTYENALLLARELLTVYAKRQIAEKKKMIINTEWDTLARKTFDFTETVDQMNAIESVYADLSADVPSDRLICGDVGFGKTEVALRAAVQAVANGYQVAMLVPTTILAEQHYINFVRRLAHTPIRVGHLSRFVSDEQSKETVKGLADGSVDIVVSTHKLIRSEIKFKNLGLLVIDEEQKFGVKDKEKLKDYRSNIDCLTLTATPIPRTMYMALSGVRSISQISSIPEGRRSVETEIAKYYETTIKTYIDREIERKGQIYFLHNRVQSIGGTKRMLSKLYPSLNIEIAHGQMPERLLAKRMIDFTEGKIDILVCSTIIESGIDLPNVNTLIVEESDRFGLSQLYQIRGRIGRSTRQSYALFTYKNKKMTNNAVKRLEALSHNTELGTGFEIALSDLEIRGGGNILGKEQHGSMEAVGLMLYSKLLKLAVDRLKEGNLLELA